MTTVVPTSTPELQRPSIPHPANGATVEVFADWGRAVEHLCDHVLTAPECDGWKVVVVGWEEVLNLDDGSCRLEYSKNARFPQGHSAQQLFDLYAEAIRLAALDAKNLGWHGSDGPVTVALGTSGVLVLIQGKTVLTAFLPGHGDPVVVVAARVAASPTRAVLPRERGMRRRSPTASQAVPGRERRAQELREAQWSDDERLYHRVFHPAVQFIRSRYHSMRDLNGRMLRCDYALLKPVLPPLSQLKYPQWLELRQQYRSTVLS